MSEKSIEMKEVKDVTYLVVNFAIKLPDWFPSYFTGMFYYGSNIVAHDYTKEEWEEARKAVREKILDRLIFIPKNATINISLGIADRWESPDWDTISEKSRERYTDPLFSLEIQHEYFAFKIIEQIKALEHTINYMESQFRNKMGGK